jgi:DNA-3-methyladenine glycosylase II
LAVTTEETLRKAERHLARVDPVMKRLIREHGGCPLAQRAYQPFDMLINSIISQQLSCAAAASIKRRLGEIIT